MEDITCNKLTVQITRLPDEKEDPKRKILVSTLTFIIVSNR